MKTEELSLGAASLQYVLLQRTEYLLFAKIPILNRLPYRFHAAVEALSFPKKIQRLFSEDMRRKYSTIEKHLPASLSSVLDIGCGIGGIDVFLSRAYPNLEISLLDKSRLDRKVFYGFEPEGSFYNSLELTRSFLETNGVPPEKIHAYDVTEKDAAFSDEAYDLIISLISWGFHYPVETYLEEAYRSLKNGGMLILDVRKGTGGEDAVRQRFGNMQILASFGKYERVAALKQ